MQQKIIMMVIATFSLTMIGATTVYTVMIQQAFAPKNECAFGLTKCWCYNTSTVQLENCFLSAQACKQAQSTDPSATSTCYRGHP
jgi:hypothetical protein